MQNNIKDTETNSINTNTESMSFLDYISKTMKPIESCKSDYYKYIFVNLLWGLNQFVMIYRGKYIVDAMVAKDLDGVILYASIMLAMVIVLHICSIYMYFAGNTISNLLSKYLYNIYTSKFLFVDHNHIESVGSGRVSSIIRTGINDRKAMITDIANYITDFIINFGAGLIVVFYYSRVIGIILVGVMIIVRYIAKYTETKLVKFKKLEKENRTEFDGYFQKIVHSKFEILQNNQEKYETSKLSEYLDNIKIYVHKIIGYRQRYLRAPTIMMNMLEFAMAYVICVQVIYGNNTVGDYMLFVMLFSKVKDNLRFLGEINTRVAERIIHIEKLWETIDHSPQIIGYDIGSSYSHSTGSISLQSVSFGYHSSHNIIQNLSLDIRGSTKTALVGPSGGGKSTIIKLIAGYIRPDSGTIYIDDQALPSNDNINTHNHISLQSYYSHIGYLTQEPSVFDGSIRENLLYGSIDTDNFTDEYIDRIISLSCCQWIYELVDGLDTHIGEKGIKLSGGQRQRLAIAKIMIKNPDIILLDEPTSALDSENEELVTQALDNLFQGKTVIIIAHRLQTVKHADQILYIAKDKDNHASILERGTHTQLLDLGGHYYKMVELQSGF